MEKEEIKQLLEKTDKASKLLKIIVDEGFNKPLTNNQLKYLNLVNSIYPLCDVLAEGLIQVYEDIRESKDL